MRACAHNGYELEKLFYFYMRPIISLGNDK